MFGWLFFLFLFIQPALYTDKVKTTIFTHIKIHAYIQFSKLSIHWILLADAFKIPEFL